MDRWIVNALDKFNKFKKKFIQKNFFFKYVLVKSKVREKELEAARVAKL